MTRGKKKSQLTYLVAVVLIGVVAIILTILYGLNKVSFRPSSAQSLPAFGVLGDSNSDEYRADDNRASGTAYAQTTLNWVELLQTKRSFNFGPWGSWGGERRTGYKYNWARSGATSESMISNGQHTGLAQQIAAGEVGYALIYVGTNDFHSWNGTYAEVYNRTISDTQLQTKVDRIVSSLTTAVDTLKQAGSVKIILANYSDPGQTVEIMRSFPDAAKRARVTNAITQINSRLAQVASSRGVYLADIYNFGQTLLSRVDQSGNLRVGSENITLLTKGYEPHHLQLGDSVGHPGTVGSGLIANFFINSLNSGYSVNIPTFTDSELLVNAGIGVAATVSPTQTAMPTATVVATVRPTATATVRPTATATVRPTIAPTVSPTVRPTTVPTPTATPVAGAKSIRIVTSPNNFIQKYVVFDGIRENSTVTEVTSSRFSYSTGWTKSSGVGVNKSDVIAATTKDRTITFTTNSSKLEIMTFRHIQAGSFKVYVNNNLKLTYNASAWSSQYVNVEVPLQ